MIRFVTPLLLSLTLMCVSDCAEFCDLKSFDNVFNVGHFVHLTRCGQVWTFDPRMNDRSGGFIRDYSWYVFARGHFHKNIETRYGKYDDKYLRFAAFSFHEIECGHINENIAKKCHQAIKRWNNFGVIVDNYTAIAFKYEYEIYFRNDTNNALSFPSIQYMNETRDKFWPDITALTKDFYNWPAKSASIHSALFSPNDYLLYIVLLTDDEKHFCITYLNMDEMLFDVQKINPDTYNWMHPNCFTGHVIGMFYDEREGKSYIVGRVNEINPQFEDQVYTLNTQEGTPAEFSPLFKRLKRRTVRVSGEVQNLRDYFGCHTKQMMSSFRKKRAVEESKQMTRFSWKAFHKELNEDWIQLSVMSVVVLFLLFLIFKQTKN